MPFDARRRILLLGAASDFSAAYNVLLEAAPNPDAAPALWELLARLADEGGATPLATAVYGALWSNGFHTAAAAAGLARAALAQGNLSEARTYLTRIHGADPQPPQARILLARTMLASDADSAAALLTTCPLQTLDDAIEVIDLLRGLDRFGAASKIVQDCAARFPGDQRLRARAARLLALQGDWRGALGAWVQVGDDHPDSLLQQARILLRLDRPAEAADCAARLFGQNAAPEDRFTNAIALGVPSLITAAFLRLWSDHRHGRAVGIDWARICQQLLDIGRLGALVWLGERGAPVPPGLRGNMHRILRAEVIEAIARQDLSSAFAIQSPQIFLSELDAFPKPAPTGPVSDRILVANATLAAGGAERQIVALAQALLGQGIPADRLHFALFSLVTDRGHDHFLPILRDLGVHVHDLRSQLVPDNSPAHVASFALPRPLRDDVLPLAELVRKLRPQVLHGWQDRAAVAAGWVGMAEGVPRVVMSARNMQPQRRGASQPYIAPILTALANQPTMQMTANSMAGARDYEDWLGLPFERVATLYNGIGSFGVPLPHGSVTPHNRLVIGGVFRLAANKRPFLWLDTIRALVDCLPDFAISARLVGTGPLRADILAHARSIGLDRFELASTLHQPTEIYDGMDAMLLMSRVEGLPNVVLEAQALGLPVAACDVGGVREAVYVGPVGGGLILHADTTAAQAAQELAQWIIGVRGHGAAQRRDFVASRYGLDALGKKVVSLYQGQTGLGADQ